MHLAVRALRLRRFRSHTAFEHEFDTRPVAIHGPNGVGKTNILEALSYLAPGRGLRGAKAEEAAGRPEPIGWSVQARLETPEGAAKLDVALDLRAGGARKSKIDDEAATQTEMGRRLRVVWLTPAMDRLWIEGAAERRRFLDRMTQAFTPSHAEASAKYERAMRERNKLLKEPRPNTSWLAALEERLAQNGVLIIQARAHCAKLLSEAQKSAKTLFPHAQIAINGELERALLAAGFPSDHQDEASSDAKDALAHYTRLLEQSRMRDAAAGRTLLGPHRADLQAIYAAKGVEARQCSTGEQKALLVSLILASARAVTTRAGAPPLILLDEVAAHFDPNRREALFDEICALGAQAWMTGAEESLFDALGQRAQRLELSAANSAH